MKGQIFYDETKKRQKLVKRFLYIFLLMVIVLLGNFIFSFYTQPKLQNLSFASTGVEKHFGAKKIISNENDWKGEKEKLQKLISQTGNSEIDNTINTYAYYVERDDAAASSLQKNLSKIDVLIPEWLSVTSSGMQILYPQKYKQTLDYVRKNRGDIRILPHINNFNQNTDSRDENLLASVLQDPEKQNLLISQILDFIDTNKLDGLSIDFEDLSSKTWNQVVGFLAVLYPKIQARGGELLINLPFQNDSVPYQKIAQNSSKIIFMAYDEHWASSNAGAIASINWYLSGLDSIKSQFSGDKYILAIGNYGYDYDLKNKTSTTLSWQEALNTMKESSGDLVFDKTSLNPRFDYYDEKNILHNVWFLDAVTAFNQIQQARKLGATNFAFWRLGSEDPSFWNLINSTTLDENNSYQYLQTLWPGYDIDYEGSGFLLKLRNKVLSGTRQLSYDNNLDLINDEKIISFPTALTIDRYGLTKPKNLILTFDDGPSQYTPQILKILQTYNVPAVFFNIGANSEKFPSITEKEYTIGETIGSHTFTHPDISTISPIQLKLELTSTQKLLQAITNHSVLLFRPPYSVDIEPRNLSEAETLFTISDLGYYIMGLNIDPNDWENPGAEKIFSRVMEQVASGNVILLHDGGGDRSQTLAALPKIITSLQASGYTFISPAQALGFSQEKLMPSLTGGAMVSNNINKVLVNTISNFNWIVHYIFLLGIGLGLFRLAIIIVCAILQKIFSAKNIYKKDYSSKVSVIVPAYNEGVVILKTLQNLLESDYKNLEILFVDDGSSDDTYSLAQEKYGNDKRIKIFTKSNGGKASALNYGIENSSGEIVVVQDADTIFYKDAISQLVKHFSNPKVGAVAGNVLVGNTDNFIGRLQAVEYITSQNLDRRAFDILQCITVVPGAIGAWRRKALEQVGLLSHETLAEDADLTIKVLSKGWRIEHEENAIALTEAPDSIGAFMKQRFRRMYGTLQVVRKHADKIFSTKNIGLGWFALPNLFIFQLIFPLLAPVLDAIGFFALVVAVFNLFGHFSQTVHQSAMHVVILYLVFVLLDAIVTILSFAMEKHAAKSLGFWFFIQKIVYRFLMYNVGLRVIFSALSGTGAGWNKLKRKGLK